MYSALSAALKRVLRDLRPLKKEVSADFAVPKKELS